MFSQAHIHEHNNTELFQYFFFFHCIINYINLVLVPRKVGIFDYFTTYNILVFSMLLRYINELYILIVCARC